jgi:hypothetical protein
MRTNEWGLEGYIVPNNDYYFLKPHTFVSKGKKENFIEVEARRKKDLPAPSSYNLKSEWGGNKYKDCLGHSGQWLKAPKKTMIDDILKMKKLKLPGPGQYKMKSFKIQNTAKQNTEKGEFINNCRWYGQQTPGHKYKINWVR